MIIFQIPGVLDSGCQAVWIYEYSSLSPSGGNQRVNYRIYIHMHIRIHFEA